MKNILDYKGYLGSIEFEIDGPTLVGKLLFIRDVITYSAQTADGLVKAFHEAVDDYLQTCEALGDTPDTPCKGTFNVRVGATLHRDVAVIARNRGQSLNEFVCGALTYAVQNAEHGAGTNERVTATRNIETMSIPATSETLPAVSSDETLIHNIAGGFYQVLPKSAATVSTVVRKKGIRNG